MYQYHEEKKKKKQQVYQHFDVRWQHYDYFPFTWNYFHVCLSSLSHPTTSPSPFQKFFSSSRPVHGEKCSVV